MLYCVWRHYNTDSELIFLICFVFLSVAVTLRQFDKNNTEMCPCSKALQNYSQK